jgi:hypothetical protein
MPMTGDRKYKINKDVFFENHWFTVTNIIDFGN